MALNVREYCHRSRNTGKDSDLDEEFCEKKKDTVYVKRESLMKT